MKLIVLLDILQIIGALIPLIGIGVLLKNEQTKSSTYLMIASFACLIVNSGYFLTLHSQSHEEAMYTLKMEYLGNILFYFFFILFIYTYLRISYPKWLFSICIAGEIIEALCLWNEKLQTLVVRPILFEEEAFIGFHYLQTEPGIMGMIRYSFICLLLLFALGDTIYRLFSTHVRSERMNFLRFAGAQVVIMASLLITLLGSIPYNIMPICSSIAVLFIVLSVVRGEFYNVTDMGREWAVEHMEDIFIIVDSEYRFLDANETTRRTVPELKDKAMYSSVSKELREVFERDQDEWEWGERSFVRKVTAIKRGKEVVGYSLILMEVTELRQLMKQVEAERDRAEEASEARSRFMSTMSHEIRTPMNAIVGMTEIMLRGSLPQQQREYLMNIRNSGNALLAIINDILDFSKIDAGKMELVCDNYDPMSMLNDLRMIFLNRIGNKPVKLLFDIDPELPAKLYGDSLRLRQVIINIANNAIKFTEEGFVKLTIQVREIVEDDIILYFSIQDTGQGIREEDFEKLFESFGQVDTKKNHNKEGTGLGLSISQRLVELMEGNIGVRSTYGEGSEFYFTIHQKVRSKEKAGSIDEAYELAEAGTETDFTAPGADVLLVDDNEMNRKVGIGLLEPLQMNIDTAENGAQALEMICKKHYDLIFMDHMMPVMDGVEATESLRRMEEDYYKTVPVIALTANAVNEAKEAFTKAGMNDFVPKPIEMKVICAKIKQWLPSEKIHLLSEEEKAAQIEEKAQEAINGQQEMDSLQIPGLDAVMGIKNSGTKELFLSLLGDFYKLIDLKSQKIEKCLSDSMYRDYTIEVHALKSTARMIGAMELSEEFYRLEQYGNAEDAEAMRKETPAVLEHYRSYKEALEPFAVAGEEEKKEVSREELIELLYAIREAVDGFDLDAADLAMKRLEECRIPKQCRKQMELLRAYLADVAMEEILEITDQMVRALQEE